MKTIVVRHRNSGYSTTITPLAEDAKYWYDYVLQHSFYFLIHIDEQSLQPDLYLSSCLHL
jgi:hypothetical protein